MKTVSIPIVDGKYRVLFPEKCVYCGAPSEVTLSKSASAGGSRRTRYATVDVPYCAEHARQSKRNTRVLNLGLVSILLFSCCALFGITTSINRTPPVWLLVFLAFVAVGLALVGVRALRKLLGRSNPSMADMLGRSHLGLNVDLAGDEILFSFTNDQMADEFARLNGQAVSEGVSSQLSQDVEGKGQATTMGQGEMKQFHLQSLLTGGQATALISDLLEREANVLLTPTWIAQAQKAYSQQMFMEVERDTLWPMVGQLMADLVDVLSDEKACVWAGTALALLDEARGAGDVTQRVEKVMTDPAATPRGHYEEGMHGYFRGLQFLIKSVFDVRLNPVWCEPIQHLVFPWSALTAILEALRAHPDLRSRWEDLHRFYSVATGEPDCVAIAHLLDQPDVQPETVVALGRELNVPQINRKMGIGVQGLAERFTRHGVIFEHLKETFLPDVSRKPIPRDSVYAVVNMHTLLYGFEHPIDGKQLPMLLNGQVGGLLEALSTVRHQPMTPFFDQFLMAQYELIADLPTPEVSYLVPRLDPTVERLDPYVRRRLNGLAANLASLLELSILAAKQPTKVVARSPEPPSQARVYVEQAPRAFFAQLGQAGQTLADVCQKMISAYGRHPAGERGARPDRADPSIDFAVIHGILADLSEGGRFVPKGSEEWFAVAPLVELLKRNPNVTADAYRHVGPGGQYFLQWCTAMASFKARMSDGTAVEGGDLLFVEGWNDTLVPGRSKPLTNSAWRKMLGKMALADLNRWTPAPVP